MTSGSSCKQFPPLAESSQRRYFVWSRRFYFSMFNNLIQFFKMKMFEIQSWNSSFSWKSKVVTLFGPQCLLAAISGSTARPGPRSQPPPVHSISILPVLCLTLRQTFFAIHCYSYPISNVFQLYVPVSLLASKVGKCV